MYVYIITYCHTVLGEDFRFPRPPAEQSANLTSQGGVKDGDVHNPLWEQKTRDIVHEDNDEDDDDDDDDDDDHKVVNKAKSPPGSKRGAVLLVVVLHEFNGFQLLCNPQYISLTGAFHAPVANPSTANSQHRYTPVSVPTRPQAPPVPTTAPAVPTPAMVTTPVQPIVSPPPIRKLRPPPREGEDRAIPIHLVPIRRVDMVPEVVVDPPTPAPPPVPPGKMDGIVSLFE